MQPMLVNQLPTYADLCEKPSRSSDDRPAWVSRALAWMREEYRRSSHAWISRFESPEVRARLAGC